MRLRLYKGNAYVLGRSSEEKLYSEEDASMDSLETFDPSETVCGPLIIVSLVLLLTISLVWLHHHPGYPPQEGKLHIAFDFARSKC